MERQRYITIQEWMLELGIKGNELTTFALIYGFSLDGESWFTGSSAYVANWLCVERQAALLILKRLTEKGLIEKDEVNISGVKLCRYRASAENVEGIRKTYRGGTENVHNNNSNNNRIKIESNTACARFAKPTISEIAEYCRERGNSIKAQDFFDWYEANGWKVGRNPMKDWRAAIRTWEAKRKTETRPTGATQQQSAFRKMMNMAQRIELENNNFNIDYDEQ